MTPVTKRTTFFPSLRGQKGQITIFFASSIIVLITLIAFVINLGMFVKAKINLQNATDAAAYAGAATQSRHLTNISYLNWEMRNVFKEWMFKYYVLGNLNIENVQDPSTAINGAINFGLRDDPNPRNRPQTRRDIYSFPSVCIHPQGIGTNLCTSYSVPGLPRFEVSNTVGIDETTEVFVDAIVKKKADDCAVRSQLNFGAANLWAYNVLGTGGATIVADAPQIANHRPGAYPQALELAVRIRNLERAMNREPVEGVCTDSSSAAGSCISDIGTIGSTNRYGNERVTKAFWSGYRNLGNNTDAEMKNSFTLTELSPRPVRNTNAQGMSNILINNLYDKYYLDLKLMMVNYVSFFNSLVAYDTQDAAAGDIFTSEGACQVSKVAIPIPGYPLGFYKNPDLLTYYAVRGEANFIGMFNPFRGALGGGFIKLSAYAAAKPFGGRIGPMLFQESPEASIRSRSDSNKRRSIPYITGLNLTGVPNRLTGNALALGEYAPGAPVPLDTSSDPNGKFWISDPSDPIGGFASSLDIYFGIPNLVYDFINGNMSSASYSGGSAITAIMRPAAYLPPGPRTDFTFGLHNKEMMTKFRQNLPTPPGASPTTQDINQGIDNARAPTLYDAANYLVPVPYNIVEGNPYQGGLSETFGLVNNQDPSSSGIYNTLIYAPLYASEADDADVLYRNASEVMSQINQYLQNQESAINKYIVSMNLVAQSIYNQNRDYINAARSISDIPDFASNTPASQIPQSCQSIAGAFNHFFTQRSPNPAGCNQSFPQALEAYYNTLQTAGSNNNSKAYLLRYKYPDSSLPDRVSNNDYGKLMTGYMPGPNIGGNGDGTVSSALSGNIENYRRSAYSTKFVSVESVSSSGSNTSYGDSNFPIMSESETPTARTPDVSQNGFRNSLATPVSGDIIQ